MTMHQNDRFETTRMRAGAPAMRGPDAGRPDFMTSLSDAVRENPVPAALIGMGALWLFMGGGNTSLLGGRGRTSLLGTVAQGADSMAHGASDLAQGAAHAVGRMGQSIASGVSSGVGGLAGAVSDTAGRVGDYVSGSLQGVDAQSDYRNPNFAGVDRGGGVRSSVSGMTNDVTRGLQDMFERHPIALGVAGIALGAAVGASLPVTEAERDTLGKASETVRDKLGDVAVQAKDMASAAAKEIGAATGNGPG